MDKLIQEKRGLEKKKKLIILYLAFAKRSLFLLPKLCVDRTVVTVGIEEPNGKFVTPPVDFSSRFHSLG